MNWKKEFNKIEKSFGERMSINWEYTYNLILGLTKVKSNDVELYIRSLYILHNIIVEERCSETLSLKMEGLLREIFVETRKRFSENSEYIFFIGEILHIAEWYWGLEDTSTAIAFHKKAFELEPRNLLFEWAYRYSDNEDTESGFLACKILENDKSRVAWLVSKGFPGQYILRRLESSCKDFIESEYSK